MAATDPVPETPGTPGLTGRAQSNRAFGLYQQCPRRGPQGQELWIKSPHIQAAAKA